MRKKNLKFIHKISFVALNNNNNDHIIKSNEIKSSFSEIAFQVGTIVIKLDINILFTYKIKDTLNNVLFFDPCKNKTNS